MTVQKFEKRRRKVVQASVATAVALGLVLTSLSILSNPSQPSIELTAGTDFTITSTVTTSPGCTAVALLYPGIPRCLAYTVHNSLNVPINVNSLNISDVTAPTACPVSNLDVSGTTFSGSLIVPATGTNTTSVPISLIDTATNQDLCQGATFDFTYSGTATYAQAYATTVAETSSGNPSDVGQPVTYTATVTATEASGQDPVPNSPTGTVTFEDGSTTLCTTNIPVASASGTTSTATCSPPADLTPGTHPITAIYSSSDTTKFSNSTSPVFTQTVNGAAPFFGSMGGTQLNKPIVGMAATPDGNGYWEVASDGGIFSFGDAGFYGPMGGTHLNKAIVGIAATPDSQGYWLVASDGGIFAFGDAGFYGSMGGTQLNKPILGMAATPDGNGYWEVASDGGIFSFGDAAFYGSMGGTQFNKPIVGMAATPDGNGYWEVASDGGIFSFGDAAFYGSMGGTHLNKPILGMTATPDGNGYWLVASDGGIFSFGDAPFAGSMGGTPLNRPIVGMSADPASHGYWEVASDGGIFSFGSAVSP
jgi:hypothetical protein